MKYRSGYKYQLAEDYTTITPIYPKENIITRYICLSTKGYLTISEGYAWDGASGPTIDTKNTMVPSLVHDALYQLIRERHLPQSARTDADILLYDLLRERGMFFLRAWLWHREVSKFAGWAADPKNVKKIHEAP